MRIETRVSLPEDMAEEFLKAYRAAFEPLEVLAAARQSLTDDEFMEEMANPAFLKWVAWDDLGKPCGMTFMTTDLSLLPWVSAPYYRAKFPEHYERGAIYYFGALLVHPDYQGSKVVIGLLEALLRKTAEDDAICAFDCCGFNIDTKPFQKMIADVAERVSVSADLQEIDVQRYYAYALRGTK